MAKKIILNEGSFDPSMTLAKWLRLNEIGLKGTKIGCEEGGCGACIVLVSKYDPITKKIIHKAQNSCLMLMIATHHLVINTIEGIKDKTSLINKLSEYDPIDCGYCAPGFVMTGHSYLINKKSDSNKEMKIYFDGNYCRCSGYRGFSEGIKSFTKPTNVWTPQFPDEFLDEPKIPVEINYKNAKFCVPTSIQQLVHLKAKYPNSTIIVGGSEVALNVTFGGMKDSVYISTHLIKELFLINICDGKLIIGSNTSLDVIRNFCLLNEKFVNENEKRILKALIERLSVFASQSIRNSACIVGNIIGGGGHTDMSNFLLASKCNLKLIDSKTGKEKMMPFDDFFTGYRANKLCPTDIIKQIEIPLCQENEYFYVYKQAHRNECDISYCSSAMRVKINPSNNIIEDMAISYSGAAPYPKSAHQTEKFMIGKAFTLDTFLKATKVLLNDYKLNPEIPNENYIINLIGSLLYRFYNNVERERGRPYDSSACDTLQFINKLPSKLSVVNKNKEYPLKTISSNTKSETIDKLSGKTVFTSDLPSPEHCYNAYFIRSSIPHGKIISTDFSKVLNYPNVIDVITHKDIKGINYVGFKFQDEDVFAEKLVHYFGQPIALVIAKDETSARNASKLAKIQYEELPSIVSIKEAINSSSFYQQSHSIQTGNINKGFDQSDKIIEGTTSVGYQSHFYMETQNSIVIPNKDKSLDVFTSAEDPLFIKNQVSACTGLSKRKINVHVTNNGGSFGGKRTRSMLLTNALSVAAQKLNHPVRMQLNRSTDMEITGGRHPIYAKYKCGVSNSGKINALSVDFYIDGGASLDLSGDVSDNILLQFDGAYHIPNRKINSFICKTNNISNTAFMDSGCAEASVIMDTIMEHISESINQPVIDVRYQNLYREGDINHLNTTLENVYTPECWNFIKERINYAQTREKIDEFNRTHKFKKRGFGITPVKYGIKTSMESFKQIGALINISKDGLCDLIISGDNDDFYSRMRLIASKHLCVPVETIRIKKALPKDNVCNTSDDMKGNAVINACVQMNHLLAPFRPPGTPFSKACSDAYSHDLKLSSTGYILNENILYDFKTSKGRHFNYYIYGASTSIVEIDCLTGEHQILRSDLVLDSSNEKIPTTNLTQIEGAFLLGIGWLTLEEFIHGDHEFNTLIKPGVVKTNGPGFYKIPGWNTIPGEFNFSLLQHKTNPTSSKNLIEPSLVLSNSVAIAIIDALKSSRKDNHINSHLQIDYPLTCSNIQLLSGVKI